jgi:cobyrinic acid a,c-diamide synthase
MIDLSGINGKIPSMCIAGTHSGCGKTTVSLGIMAALVQRGLTVQAYKAGPDFIDPGHHRRITGRDSHNLDGWMLSRQYNREIFARHGHDADIAVLEGVMGLFDGFSGTDESGSTAQTAKWLHIPVFLVIDARSMARSAAAVALGYSRFDPDLPISGIVFNRVASKGHAEMLADAMSCLPELPVFGYLPRDEKLEIPSRHLGLVTDEDFGIDNKRRERLAVWIESNLRVDELLESLDGTETGTVSVFPCNEPDIKIGIARDEAFCFYYPENLRLLREAGAELVPFSPICSKDLPEGIKGLYFGGGYPELHCRALSENRGLLNAIRNFGLNGGPIYAECGGFMFLMREIRDLEGRAYPMVGIFPMGAQMEDRLKSLGYREIITRRNSILGHAATRVRGHEFHYSRIREMGPMPESIYCMTDRKTTPKGDEGFVINNVLGSYVHLHWGSNPAVATEFVGYCRKYG